jgi:outer membrane protein OmpA-like peptidoglycan-associated protein
MNTKAVLIVMLSSALSLPASGQSTEVLQGSQITKAALVGALIPRDRSFGPSKQSILITFETNSTELTPEARRSLDVVGQALNDNQLIEYKFIIEGHADPRGSAEWNQQLSEGRADAVRQYLVQNQNVSDKRLHAVGKGANEPLNQANPAAPENRRVTIVTSF